MEDRVKLAESQGYDSPETWLRTEYWTKGKSSSEIAAVCKVTPETIRNWLRWHDIPRKPTGGDNRRDMPLTRYRALGDTSQMTAFEIADAVGCTPRCVWILARRYSLDYRRVRR